MSANATKGPTRSREGISLQQAIAFRLRRHHLSERAPANLLVPVVDGMGGAQAQVLSAAQLSLWARIQDLEAAEVDRALWFDRTLVKAWCMRRTLYLLPARDLAVYVRGSALRAEKEIRWALNHGVSGEVLERLLRALLSALDEPLTRKELTARLSKSLGLPMRWRRGGGWGSQSKVPSLQVGRFVLPAHYLLHLAGARGVICSGPSEANESTFVRADAWVPGWQDLRGEPAEEELLRRYLRGFGPATPEDFQTWTQMRLLDARAIWKRVEDELTPVDLEGRDAWVLRDDRNELATSAIGGPTVRLLPYFDSFLLGHRGREHLTQARHVKKVYRNQGWVAPVVLVDGRAEGVWAQSRKGDRLSVQVEMFGRVSRSVRSAIQEETRSLARFLGGETVNLKFGPAGSPSGMS
jgi:hypothetical protein